MEEIINYNFDGLCCLEFCGQRYTYFTIKKINGLEIVLAFCKKHANEYENNLYKNI